MGGGRRTSSTAQGPLYTSWGRGPVHGPCWRGGRGRFRQSWRTFCRSASCSSCSSLSRHLGGGWGGWDRVHTGPCPLLYTYFRVSEPVLASIQMIQTLRQGPGGSQHEVAHPDRVDTKLQAWGQPCIIPSSLSHARNCNYLLTVNGTCRAAARFCRRAVAAGIPSRTCNLIRHTANCQCLH